MSVDINVFVTRESLPRAEQWQEQIRSLGYSLTIDTDVDLKEFLGLLPCRLDGHEVGFEYCCDSLEDTMFDPNDPSVAARIGGRDLCVGFCVSTGSSDVDLFAAAIASACLAKLCDGVLWAADDFVVGMDPVEWANASIAEFSR